MKKALLILLGLALIASPFIADRYTTPETSAVLVLHDLTPEAPIVTLDVSVIKEIFDLEGSGRKGAFFKYTSISDTRYANEVSTATLPGTDLLNYNKFNRNKSVKKFKAEIDAICSEALGQKSNLPKSIIYKKVVDEINLLVDYPSKEKMVLVYSDLFENGKELSLHRQVDQKLLMASPDTIKATLLSMATPKSLNGVRVFLICRPLEYEEELLFEMIAGIYKQILETAGAEVMIGLSGITP
jgi:hypothetical protein